MKSTGCSVVATQHAAGAIQGPPQPSAVEVGLFRLDNCPQRRLLGNLSSGVQPLACYGRAVQPVHQLGLGVHLELAEDRFQVVSHGVLAHLEEFGNRHNTMAL